MSTTDVKRILKVESPVSFLNDMGDTEFVVKDVDLFAAMREMKVGEDIWYRDYDNTGDKCISLYKRVARTKLAEDEVFVFAYDVPNDDLMDAAVVHTTAPDDVLREALNTMYEWTHEFLGSVVIDEETFARFFGESYFDKEQGEVTE